MGRLTNWPLAIIITLTAMTGGWVMRGNPTEEQPKDIPPFGLTCIDDLKQWSDIQTPAGQLALSPTQLARVFCSIPAVHKGYKNHEDNAKQQAQDAIHAIIGAENISHN